MFQTSTTCGPRIVAIGGGTGLPTVLRGLASPVQGGDPVDRSTGGPTAIVCVTDDGGSSGALRRGLGVPPPGDIRNCLVALLEHTSGLPELLNHRFSSGDGLAGHAIGNLMLAGLTELTGDLAHATRELSRILKVPGLVLPATTEDIALRAEFYCGAVVEGETAISGRRAPIRWLSLSRPAQPLPEALEALTAADLIIVGPGSLYTSLLPPLLVQGFIDALMQSHATKIYVANLMTEPGETDGFTVADHLNVIRQHVGADLFDFALVNSRPLTPSLEAAYASRGSLPVEVGTSPFVGRTQLVPYELCAERHGHKIRHQAADLARAIMDIFWQAHENCAPSPDWRRS